MSLPGRAYRALRSLACRTNPRRLAVAALCIIHPIWRQMTPVCQRIARFLREEIATHQDIAEVRHETTRQASSNPKVLPQVDAADIFILHNLFRRPALQYLTVVQDVGPVDDTKCLAHIVIGYQDADAAVLEMRD